MNPSKTPGAGHRFNDEGFTLIELLVVISIVALLLALLLPSLARAREESRMIKCAMNQRSIAQAAFVYGGDFMQKLPKWGTAYSFPFYGNNLSTILDDSNNFAIGNYIMEGEGYGAVGTPYQHISFTQFIADYVNARGDMWFQPYPGGYDHYIGFNDTNTAMHCPSSRVQQGGFAVSQPNPFISYALTAMGGQGTGYTYANSIELGYPRNDRVGPLTIAGEGRASVAMVVDLVNHPESSNYADMDGSVHRFLFINGRIASDVGDGHNFYLPAGYTYLKNANSPDASSYDTSQFGDPFNNDLLTTEFGAAARSRMSQFGYTLPAQ